MRILEECCSFRCRTEPFFDAEVACFLWVDDELFALPDRFRGLSRCPLRHCAEADVQFLRDPAVWLAQARQRLDGPLDVIVDLGV